MDNTTSGQIFIIALRCFLSVFIPSKLRNTLLLLLLLLLLLFNKFNTSYAVKRCDSLLSLFCRFHLFFVTCVFFL
jgi:hypothetical protein